MIITKSKFQLVSDLSFLFLLIFIFFFSKTHTGCNNRPTGCNNTRTGSNKKHTIHDHTPEDFENFQKGQYKSKRGTRKKESI